MDDMFDDNGAQFSSDNKYRYVLWRIWDKEKPLVAFIGLNPSKANQNKNDNTITKLMKVARHNGFGGFYMLNLFAIVSTNPRVLKTHNNPLGDNDEWLMETTRKVDKIVFAWGNFQETIERAKQAIEMFDKPYCLFQNKNGSPKHPLYCKDDTIIIPFDLKKYMKNE